MALFDNSPKPTVPQNGSFSQKPVTPAESPPAAPARQAGPLPQAAPPTGYGQQQASGPTGFFASNKLYFALGGIGIIVVAALAYLAFRPSGTNTTGANVELAVDAPETVPSGGEAVYKFRISNRDEQRLSNLSLETTYPEGFAYESSSPKAENLSGTVFKVPDLIAGQNAVVIVKVKASGALNETKQVSGRLRYRFGGFTTDYTKEVVASARIAAPDVTLEIDGPKQVSNAQLAQYTVTYRASQNQALPGARLRLTYPEGFSFAQGTPAPSIGSNVWNLGDLAPGASGSVTVTGSYRSAVPGQSRTVAVELLALAPSGDYFTQAQASAVTAIDTLPLIVSQEIVGTSGSNIVKPGDTVQVSVRYQNNAAVAARGVSVQLSLDSHAVDLSSIQADGAQVSGGTVTWNAASTPGLEALGPNGSGTVTVRMRVKNPATADASKNLTVKTSVAIRSQEYETPFPGNDLELKVSSPSELNSGLDYVEGSLPPRVGTQTTYLATLSLANATNDYSNAVVTAFIPLGAGGFVDGSVSLGEASKVTYDPTTGKLTWNVGSVPAHAGTFSPARTVSFKVRLSASQAQVNQTPTLVKAIRYQAKDLFTGEDVSGGTEDVTTASISGSDPYSKARVTQ